MAVTHSLYRESGLVVVDQETCTGCRECVDTCPTETLTFHAGTVVPNDTSPLGCIACGHCMMVCPEACITVTGRGMLPADLVPLPPPDAKRRPMPWPD